jgi:signal transduction histidine kinase
MKLSRFITENMDQILLEWVAFARTLGPAASGMSVLALRDHARPMLQEIALDIETSQDAAEQDQKSKGQEPEDERSAAAEHGTLRQSSHFTLIQLAAEFRALRATVLRLWLPHVSQMSQSTTQDMIRFNEAIDQALAESVVTYSSRADQSRELFLAILGHDLRAPLSTMATAGELLLRPKLPPDQVPVVAARVLRSARLMTSMVEDLLGFTRTQLGSRMPTLRVSTDIGRICAESLEDAKATHPETAFELQATGDLGGEFDPVRLHQLFTNLLVNAAQYGARGSPVVIAARRDGAGIEVQVNNHGKPIPELAWRSIFKPLIQLPAQDDDDRPRTSLGLGLFVAREIALGHDGSIDVKSDEVDGTTFTVWLPIAEPEPAH